MGISANQARLLTLTARKSDLELRAQQISARKMLLSLESQQYATNYTNALNIFSTQNAGKKGHYEYTEVPVSQEWLSQYNYSVVKLGENYSYTALGDLSVESIKNALANGYVVGRWIPEQKIVSGGSSSTTTPSGSTAGTYKNLEDYRTKNNLSYEELAAAFVNAYNTKYMGTQYYLEAKYEDLVNEYYKPDSSTFLYKEVNGQGGYYVDRRYNGLIVTLDEIISAVDAGKQPTVEPTEPEETVTIIPAHYEATDHRPNSIATWVEDETGSTTTTVDITVAKAEYDSAMAALSANEKLLDMELTQINTEHSAVKTEYDAVKSLIGDNVEKSFNVFG